MSAAFVIRLIYSWETSDVPFLRTLVGDAAGYYEWAKRLVGGDSVGSEPFYQAPLYPYVLGGIIALLGDDVGAIRLAQAIWGTLAVGLMTLAATRLFGKRAGLLAGIMLALYGPAIFFDGIIQKASLACFLVCGLLAAVSYGATTRRWFLPVVVGGAVGLVALTRENALLWAIVLAGWAWAGEGRGLWRRLARLCGFVLGLALILGPVGLRNWVIGGEWSISTFQAGTNFYIGNHYGADGRYQPLVRGQETARFERDDATRLAEEAVGKKLTPREVSGYWMSRAMHEIRSDLSAWLGLMARKMAMVWNRYEVADAESLHVYAESSVILSVLGRIWHFGVLCPLAVVGVIGTWSQRRRLWVYYLLIVTMALAVALFYVMARYRFPLVPLLIPFAAVGCVGVCDRLRRCEFRELALPAVVALVVALAVNWPLHDERRLNAMATMNAGIALAKLGDLQGATRYFESAVAGHPQSAEANNNLAQALAIQGDYARAGEHYNRALAAEAHLPGVFFNLGVSLERLGRRKKALDCYEQAVKRDASDAEARAAIARLRKEN